MTVDMEDGVYYAQLAKAVTAGAVSQQALDREVLRALAFKRRLGLFEKPYVPEDLEKRVRAVAQRIAPPRARSRANPSCCSRTTRNLLPLTPRPHPGHRPAGRCARGFVRPVARARPRRRTWSACSRASANALPRANPRARSHTSPGSRSKALRRPPAGDDARIAAAVAAAHNSDLVIAVVGERESMSGEAKNRAHLDLPGNQQKLVDALLATGKPVVVVLLTGRAARGALARRECRRARACILSGQSKAVTRSPTCCSAITTRAARNPITWPRSVGQLPIHHYDPPNGRPNIPERGDYKAHWLDEPDEPLFAFGFGLCYTHSPSAGSRCRRASAATDTLTIRVRVTNTGKRDGDEVPQLYIRPRVASAVDRQTPARVSARASRGRRVAKSSSSRCPRSRSRCSMRRIAGPSNPACTK